MTEPLKYQIRIYLKDLFAQAARGDPANPAIAPLMQILAKHGATIKSQFDAFADYVAEAERLGSGDYPLYEWTKATIEDPVKKQKYLRSFTIYAGGEEVYEKEIADALEAELQSLAGGGTITHLSRHDTNPANNPQMPERFR